MISPINNQNTANILSNVNINKPVLNEEVNKSPNEKIAEVKKPAVDNVQETGINSQGNTTLGRTVDVLA